MNYYTQFDLFKKSLNVPNFYECRLSISPVCLLCEYRWNGHNVLQKIDHVKICSKNNNISNQLLCEIFFYPPSSIIDKSLHTPTSLTYPLYNSDDEKKVVTYSTDNSSNLPTNMGNHSNTDVCIIQKSPSYTVDENKSLPNALTILMNSSKKLSSQQQRRIAVTSSSTDISKNNEHKQQVYTTPQRKNKKVKISPTLATTATTTSPVKNSTVSGTAYHPNTSITSLEIDDVKECEHMDAITLDVDYIMKDTTIVSKSDSVRHDSSRKRYIVYELDNSDDDEEDDDDDNDNKHNNKSIIEKPNPLKTEYSDTHTNTDDVSIIYSSTCILPPIDGKNSMDMTHSDSQPHVCISEQNLLSTCICEVKNKNIKQYDSSTCMKNDNDDDDDETIDNNDHIISNRDTNNSCVDITHNTSLITTTTIPTTTRIINNTTFIAVSTDDSTKTNNCSMNCDIQSRHLSSLSPNQLNLSSNSLIFPSTTIDISKLYNAPDVTGSMKKTSNKRKKIRRQDRNITTATTITVDNDTNNDRRDDNINNTIMNDYIGSNEEARSSDDFPQDEYVPKYKLLNFTTLSTTSRASTNKYTRHFTHTTTSNYNCMVGNNTDLTSNSSSSSSSSSLLPSQIISSTTLLPLPLLPHIHRDKHMHKQRHIQYEPIIVDGFKYSHLQLSTCYFLTHFHSDHYQGLSDSFNHGLIFCTSTTAALCQLKLKIKPQYLIALALNTEYEIKMTDGFTFYVVLIDANHCPGAACCLFRAEGYEEVIFHAGDFRFDTSTMLFMSPILNYLIKDKISKNIHKNMNMNTVKDIDSNTSDIRNCSVINHHDNNNRNDTNIMKNWEDYSNLKMILYLDTTYCNPIYTFPQQSYAIQAALSKVREELQIIHTYNLAHPKQKTRLIFVFGAYGIGKEKLYMSAATMLQCPVYVDTHRLDMMKCYHDWPVDHIEILITNEDMTNIWVKDMHAITFKSLQLIRKRIQTALLETNKSQQNKQTLLNFFTSSIQHVVKNTLSTVLSTPRHDDDTISHQAISRHNNGSYSRNSSVNTSTTVTTSATRTVGNSSTVTDEYVVWNQEEHITPFYPLDNMTTNHTTNNSHTTSSASSSSTTVTTTTNTATTHTPSTTKMKKSQAMDYTNIKIVAFQPTGWSHNGMNLNKYSRNTDNKIPTLTSSTSTTTTANHHASANQPLDTSRRTLDTMNNTNEDIITARHQEGVTIYSVPYSEHSSFNELVDCINLFKPIKIIPTVNTSYDKVKQQLNDLQNHTR